MQAECAAKRNTRQKAAIEAAVLSSSDHPTALTVCERVRESVPGISLGTVYTTCTHAHFLCTGCGKVSDVHVDEQHFVEHAKESCTGARIDEAEIVFKGLCAECKGVKL